MRFLIIPFLSCFLLSACFRQASQASMRAESIPIKQTTSSDTSLQHLVAPYKSKMESIMLRKIGYNNNTLTKKNTESTLGNWVCDALLFFAEDSLHLQADFSIVNYGGLRINQLDSGAILLKNIYELMPFDNTLVLVDLDSAGVDLLVHHMSKVHGWPQSKTLRYAIYNDSLPTQITIHAQPLNNQKKYKILLSDYIYNGGDNAGFLSKYPSALIPVTLRDALIYAVIKQSEKNHSISSSLDQRVMIKQH